MKPADRVSLPEIFRTFLFIGATGFGGGMAIISLTERVCVHEKKWLGTDEFMHGIAFGQILGVFSLNTCTFVGYRLRGPVGAIIAAVAFIAPSFCLVTLLSWLYFRYHKLPELQAALRGTNPVIIALIIVAAYGMAKAKVKSRIDWLVAVAAFVAAGVFRVSTLTVLLAAVGWSLLYGWFRREHR